MSMSRSTSGFVFDPPSADFRQIVTKSPPPMVCCGVARWNYSTVVGPNDRKAPPKSGRYEIWIKERQGKYTGDTYHNTRAIEPPLPPKKRNQKIDYLPSCCCGTMVVENVRDGEIAGLHSSTFGRSCERHAVCGHELELGALCAISGTLLLSEGI